MPFTFSHPAIVLPLALLPRKWVSLTGLVIGSLTPDFEYFLRMKIQSSYSHTISGLFWFDLPLGLLLAFLFHNMVRDSLVENLPTVLKSRLMVFSQFDWNKSFRKHWMAVIISILIGSASHVFWDGFTHSDGCFVQEIPALKYSVSLFQWQIPYLKLLQHSSSLIGGIIIAFVLFRLPSDKTVFGQFSLKYWGILTSLTLVMIALRISGGLDYKLYGNLIVTGISAGMIALILTPIFVRQKT